MNITVTFVLLEYSTLCIWWLGSYSTESQFCSSKINNRTTQFVVFR